MRIKAFGNPYAALTIPFKSPEIVAFKFQKINTEEPICIEQINFNKKFKKLEAKKKKVSHKPTNCISRITDRLF